jgi:putative membrane protein
MKRITLAAALMAGTFSFAAYAADEMNPNATTPAAEAVQDAKAATELTREGYANAATIGNLYEIEAANLAWERSTNEDVKSFAKMLIADHTAANAKLAVLIDQAKGEAPSGLDDAHQKMIDELKGAEDANFDSVYLAQQLAAHEASLKMHTAYAESGDDEAFKTFAADSVKTVTAHIEHLKSLPAM